MICCRCKKDKPRSEFYKNSPHRAGWFPDCIECESEKNRIKNSAYRKEVIQHYGGRCACCGEDTEEFLGVHHQLPLTTKEPAIVKGQFVRPYDTGHALYMRLRKQGYPDGYQVMCHNCNMSLGFYGYCPHQGWVS